MIESKWQSFSRGQERSGELQASLPHLDPTRDEATDPESHFHMHKGQEYAKD